MRGRLVYHGYTIPQMNVPSSEGFLTNQQRRLWLGGEFLTVGPLLQPVDVGSFFAWRSGVCMRLHCRAQGTRQHYTNIAPFNASYLPECMKSGKDTNPMGHSVVPSAEVLLCTRPQAWKDGSSNLGCVVVLRILCGGCMGPNTPQGSNRWRGRLTTWVQLDRIRSSAFHPMIQDHEYLVKSSSGS